MPEIVPGRYVKHYCSSRGLMKHSIIQTKLANVKK